MTRPLTLVLLTGILAVPLYSTGSVPSPSHAVRKTLPTAISRVRTCQRGAHSKSLPRTRAVRTSNDEPAVVIVYGNQPWSWM